MTQTHNLKTLMVYNNSALPLLDNKEGMEPEGISKTTMRNRILKNLRQQDGVYPLEPREQFHFVDEHYTEHIVYFTGHQLRVTAKNFDAAKESNYHQYLYLLADNHFTWCLYRFQYHTFTDVSCGASIGRRQLELVPYDSSDGHFFSVNYLDM
jgi:hypothetical protein